MKGFSTMLKTYHSPSLSPVHNMDSDRLSIRSSDEEAEPYQSNDGRSQDNAWDTTIALVFRERRGQESVSLSDECETIHIAQDTWTLKQLIQEKTTGNMTVITLTWDHLIRSDSHFYVCEIGLQDDCKNTSSKILTGLCDRNYMALRELTSRFFKEFQTKITRIKYYPLSFELAYCSSDGFEKLGSRLGDIEDIFKSVCSVCTQMDLSLSVCLHVSDESNNDDDLDGMEFTLSLYGSESDSEDQVLPGDRDYRSVPQGYKRRSKHFGEGQENRLSLIEKELQTQREIFSAKFDDQKFHNELQQQILQSLEQNMKLLLEKQRGASVSRLPDELQERIHSSSQLEYVKSSVRTNTAKTAEHTDSGEDKDLNIEDMLQSNDATVQDTPQAETFQEKDSHFEGLVNYSGADTSPMIISQPGSDIDKQLDLKDKNGSRSRSIKSVPLGEPSVGTSSKAKEKTQNNTSSPNLIQDPDPNPVRGLGRRENALNQSVFHSQQPTQQTNHYSLGDSKPDSSGQSHSPPPELLQADRYMTKDKRLEERVQSFSSEISGSRETAKEQDKLRDCHMDAESESLKFEKPDQSFQRSSPKQTNPNKRDDNSPGKVRMASPVPRSNSGALTGKARHFLTKHGIQGKSPGVRRMIETIEAAMRDDIEMPPNAKGLNTVLCLDTSDAMGEEGFEKMKTAAMDFIDGVEDIAAKYEMEENVAVVAFGNRTRIAHHLSNDYSSVRIAVENLEYGGTASLFEALLVCICTIDGKAVPVTIGDVQVQPRVIVMTAGNTIDDIEESEQDEDTIANNSKDRVVKLMDEFSLKKNQSAVPRPVIWVPVNDTERGFLQYLSELEICRLSECADVTSLCLYQRKQEIIGSAFNRIKSMMTEDAETEVDDERIGEVVSELGGDLEEEEKDDVLSDIKQRLDKTFARSPLTMASDFDNIVELKDKGLPRLGNRVVRGPDWTDGSEDSEGPGTVINHIEGPGEERKKIWVQWDNGICKKYRFGYKNAFDLNMVQDQPRTPSSATHLEIGCEVTRGRDWSQEYNEQDGGAGGVGVVIRRNDGNVVVRWNRNGLTHEYGFGKDDKMELRVRDPTEHFNLTANSPDPNRKEAMKEGASVRDGGQWVWQWKLGSGNWQPYEETTNEKLEKEYKKRMDGSCIIQKNGDNFRILFKSNIEKKVDGSTKTEVRRICVG